MRAPLSLPLFLLALLSPALAGASSDAGTGDCIARVVSPADGTSDLAGGLTLKFSLSGTCTLVPTPTLKDPNGASIPLQLTRDGSTLTATPLGYLIDGVFEVDPISRTDLCDATDPARVTHFRVGAGPAVRAIVYTPKDAYTAGSQLDTLEIFLSEALASGGETAIPTYVTVSGLEPSDIYYLADTNSILWSWKNTSSGVPPTTTEKVTVRVKRGLSFAAGTAMAADFELSVRPADYLVHGWWPEATACSSSSSGSSDSGSSSGDSSGVSCSTGAGSPLKLAVLLALAPLAAHVSLRRRR